MGRARQPGGPHAQAQQEAPEEHGLGPVALEEWLAGDENLAALALKAPGTLQYPASALASDLIADVVAHDRRKRRDRDHQLDMQFALAGQPPRPDQARLSRDRNAAGLRHYY